MENLSKEQELRGLEQLTLANSTLFDTLTLLLYLSNIFYNILLEKFLIIF